MSVFKNAWKSLKSIKSWKLPSPIKESMPSQESPSLKSQAGSGSGSIDGGKGVLTGLERQVLKWEGVHDSNVRLRMFLYTYSGVMFLGNGEMYRRQQIKDKAEEKYKSALEWKLGMADIEGQYNRLEVKFEIATLKKQVQAVKKEVEDLKVENQVLKKDNQELKNEMGGLNHLIIIHHTALFGRLSDSLLGRLFDKDLQQRKAREEMQSLRSQARKVRD